MTDKVQVGFSAQALRFTIASLDQTITALRATAHLDPDGANAIGLYISLRNEMQQVYDAAWGGSDDRAL